MRQYLLLTLATLVTVLVAAPAVRAGDIAAVYEDGRMVYVGQFSPNSDTEPEPYSVLVQRDREGKQWRKVPVRSAGGSQAPDRARQAAPEARETQPPATAPRVRRIDYDSLIEEAGRRHGVDPELIRAIVRVESNFNPSAVSSKGAMGLMQLMPATARSLNVSNPFDPRQNVEGGVRHFKSLLESYGGNLELSLAAYNAGAGAVERNRGVPPYPETRNYVRRIRQLYTAGAGQRRRPVRSWRDERGVLHFSNVE